MPCTLGPSRLNLSQQSGLTNSAKSPDKREAENDLSCGERCLPPDGFTQLPAYT